MKTVFPNLENTLTFNEWCAYIKQEVMKQYSKEDSTNKTQNHE